MRFRFKGSDMVTTEILGSCSTKPTAPCLTIRTIGAADDVDLCFPVKVELVLHRRLWVSRSPQWKSTTISNICYDLVTVLNRNTTISTKPIIKNFFLF